MRLFVAVFPSPEVQRAAYRVIETLRRPNDGVSWVKPENLHYTMRFLGEVGDDGARRIAEAAADAASRSPAFEAALGGLGAFPSARRARVIWIGMSEGAEALVALARDLDRALEQRGFAPEGRPFSAHLTLGRLRVPGPDWTATLAGAPAGTSPRFAVDRLCVVKSQLDPRGSIYTIQADPRLGARPHAAP